MFCVTRIISNLINKIKNYIIPEEEISKINDISECTDGVFCSSDRMPCISRNIEPLMYEGEVLYNIDTGKPIDKKDFDAFIKAIEAFLNKNTKDVSKHITLDSVAKEKILNRLLKNGSLEQMQKMRLADLKPNNKLFEWIKKDINETGLSREEKRLYNLRKNHYFTLEELDYLSFLDDSTIIKIGKKIEETIKIHGNSRYKLQQSLFDNFPLNVDWRTFAELVINQKDTLNTIKEALDSCERGEKLYFKRYETGDCCDKCKQIDGIIALWSDVPLEDEKIVDKYASIAIWKDKTRIGKKIEDDWVAMGSQHLDCRGSWIKWDTDFFDATLAKINGKEEEWNSAVEAVKEEYKQKGTNPPDENSFVFRMKVQDKYRNM